MRDFVAQNLLNGCRVAVAIDIGFNQMADGSIVADADFDSCANVAGWITPAPGGVGPVTVANLMRNAVIAASRP